MTTKNRVFSRLFENKQHDAQLRAENRKQDKLKKVALGLVDEISYDYSSLQDESRMLSYLAYEWHEEKFEEYRKAWINLNDEYTHNASSILRYDDVRGDREILEQIAEKAEELGLMPYEVYDNFDDHMVILDEIEQADEKYKMNEDEFRNWS
jgi:hypothetical protein